MSFKRFYILILMELTFCNTENDGFSKHHVFQTNCCMLIFRKCNIGSIRLELTLFATKYGTDQMQVKCKQDV